jgi:UDP-GlcNAc3NAcA epimerase
MNQIIHIVGNRPQFIKLAVLYAEIEKHQLFTQQIVHTGQHFSYDMSDLFFKELQIAAPTINLNIQASSANLFIGEAAEALQNYFKTQPQSIVVVYGDTNSTLAAAIAAKQSKLPLVHIEAGVRNGELFMPEEINRILTDRLADVNYCCTKKNLTQLQHEGFGKTIVGEQILSGDLMLDAFLTINSSNKNCTTKENYVACTIHRAANLNNKIVLQNIITGLNEINKIIPVVMPIHPHTQKKLLEFEIECSFETITPLGYPDMKTFLANASLVITDSGGVSREAYFSQKKSLIIMNAPFWPEIIEASCALQSPSNTNEIIANFNLLQTLRPNFDTNIFGNGSAAATIHTHLCHHFLNKTI